MQAKQPKAFQRFLHTHRPMHKDPDGSDWEEHAKQPVWRCVEHLVKLLVRTVEYNTSAKRDGALADGVVQEEEAAAFSRLRKARMRIQIRKAELAAQQAAAAPPPPAAGDAPPPGG